ncbi:hypothetical protein IQ06DRAFT_95487 [Phaeosphaeriaceae sp. SRC1lsM3a]|nr:hypothetical protein IQ06DRAFT_95487 [Stagonospora sp. SRC1lsM3a]
MRMSALSPLHRLPRELRDRIYVLAFEPVDWFPKDWTKIETSANLPLFHELPALCQVNRIIFHEATPVFLRFYLSIITRNARENMSVHFDLISNFPNLDSLQITYNFPKIVDGVPLRLFDFAYEQELWLDTGLHYDPPDGRSAAEEKIQLEKDVQAFVVKLGLDCIINLPKLRHLHFEFYAVEHEKTSQRKNGFFRHRLCNPMWRWARERMIEKWGYDPEKDKREQEYVSTGLPEDYNTDNVSYGWSPGD